MTLKPEESAMTIIFDWVRLNRLEHCIIHIANERKVNIQRGALLKRMGVLAGVSDIFITAPRKEFHGAWIELKIGKNKPTDKQLDFLQNRRLEGYDAQVIYGPDLVIGYIQWYFDL